MMEQTLAWIFTGTAPQWGVFVVVCLAFLRLVIPWRQQNMSSMSAICDRLSKEVAELRKRLDDCEVRCENRDEIISGMQKQSVAQQIGFARILMKSLGQDNPELKAMMKTLEQLEKGLAPVMLESER
jgi:hypothetical protein